MKPSIEDYRKQSINGTLSDDLNPLFIFQSINSELLVKALNGEINMNELVENELKNRGLNKQGLFVGF